MTTDLAPDLAPTSPRRPAVEASATTSPRTLPPYGGGARSRDDLALAPHLAPKVEAR